MDGACGGSAAGRRPHAEGRQCVLLQRGDIRPRVRVFRPLRAGIGSPPSRHPQLHELVYSRPFRKFHPASIRAVRGGFEISCQACSSSSGCLQLRFMSTWSDTARRASDPVRMDIGAISAGPDPPKDIYAVIEIPLGGAPVKYELDKASGALMVDRFLHTAMFYPGNYGFIPQTLSADGDPCDVLVVTQVQVVPGAIVRCRPVGALLMEDEAGRDEKIIAVPVDALAPFYADIRNYRDLPPIMCEQIAHFFQHYKDLEKGKWVTIVKWLDV